MKKILVITMLAALALLSGCAGNAASTAEQSGTLITLSGSGADINGGGASAKGSSIVISAAGTYTVTGKLDDGQIVVDTGDEPMNVTLILDNAEICSLTDAAIYVAQAKNTHIQLAADSENILCSGRESDMSTPAETLSGAVIYAEDDLDIDGPGALSILGYINNGITCKDDLEIKGGSISVLAANNGIRGSESVEIKGGSIAVTAGNDGVKSSSGDKEGKGYVKLSGGTLAISSQGDGVSAETQLTIEGGTITVSTQGDPETQSCKGLKANSGVDISGGSLTLTSADHAIHSETGVNISGGTLTLSSSAGKGVDANGDISFTGGTIWLYSLKKPFDTAGSVSIDGGELMAYTGSEKFTGFSGSSAQAWLVCAISGVAGDTLTIGADGGELCRDEAQNAYKAFIFASSGLTAGNEYTLSNGRSQVTVTAG